MEYPLGIQTFSDLREKGCVYVDKTDLMYKILNNYKYIFLARPRRFGKSLLMTTIEAFYEGRKSLFEGLAIENLTDEWTKYPVLHIDFNIGKYNTIEGLYDILNDQLADYEAIYGRNPNNDEPQYRLRWLIKQAYAQTGKKVVLLIDEYDKPMVKSIGNKDLNQAFRDILKPFYGVLKSEDKYLKFGMLTGVSKLGKLSIFSDINNLKDISLLEEYASLCGITQQEILDNFEEPLIEFAQAKNLSVENLLEKLRQQYDGYRFTGSPVKVFNPYSLLNAFSDKKIKDYWFASGTPTILVEMLKQDNYDLSKIEGITIDEDALYQEIDTSPIPMFYQSGYLTIKDYISLDDDDCEYTLGYPNKEVQKAFLKFLLPFYSQIKEQCSKTELENLVKEIKSGNVDAFMNRIQGIFYSIPYSTDNSIEMQEAQFRNLMYIVFHFVGMKIRVESHMSKGRTDLIMFTPNHIYIMEFKMNSTPQEAIKQIYEKSYARPYQADPRKIIIIGINYSTEERSIESWDKEEFIKPLEKRGFRR